MINPSFENPNPCYILHNNISILNENNLHGAMCIFYVDNECSPIYKKIDYDVETLVNLYNTNNINNLLQVSSVKGCGEYNFNNLSPGYYFIKIVKPENCEIINSMISFENNTYESASYLEDFYFLIPFKN